ncbi:hypothetical protein [Nocardia terpenica]|uniref:Uncharacterized protein n=1 Tax=Nocardia terpenica TaxID=455432 RepID=A0A6G9Z026_9NOCA|nr:hypothetical protein [Nocardia terpenica]QIS18566.1 hypothetical protein F6W96_09940 [Nocardia terpenica]
MTTPNGPRIVDHAAHRERVAIDQQIRALLDHISTLKLSAQSSETLSATRALSALTDVRRTAFRREVGWPGNPG